VSGTFLASYLQEAKGAPFLGTDEQLGALLDFYLLEKAIFELGYEANARPEWVDIPAEGSSTSWGTVSATPERRETPRPSTELATLARRGGGHVV